MVKHHYKNINIPRSLHFRLQFPVTVVMKMEILIPSNTILKLLVILFGIKLYLRINIYKYTFFIVFSKAFFNISNRFKLPNSYLAPLVGAPSLKKYNMSEAYRFNEWPAANSKLIQRIFKCFEIFLYSGLQDYMYSIKALFLLSLLSKK